MTEIELTVHVRGRHETVGACVKVPDLLHKAFQPVDFCDEAYVACVVGGVPKDQSTKVVKLREDAAKILAEELTQLLIREMQKYDTSNGYREQ
jgi:hypothetical protein